MLQKELGTEAKIELVPGTPGQFDVLMDGERIATRAKGWQRLLGGGWPSAQEVAEAARGHRS